MNDQIHCGDNLPILRAMPDASVQLIYIDPPFNTGKSQRRKLLRTAQSGEGDRIGFGGKRYRTEQLGEQSFADTFTDFESFIRPRLIEARRLLDQTGTLYFHIDYREAHYCKVMLDELFGRACFLNEIIWAYDYGGRPKRRWPAKHDTILVYVKDPDTYQFNNEEVERIPYMAPGLVGPEKAKRGKLPTDVWWHTIVATNSKEKTGYPTQKPLGILRRIVAASSQAGDTVLDFFAGSGATGAAARELGRRFILIDNSEQAMQTMARRLGPAGGIDWFGFDPST
jgi:DNA modification methylase